MKSKTKKTFIISVIALMLCVAMLVGTTYAWFTDSVTSGTNKIVAGNLDVEAYYSTDASNWQSLTKADSLFSVDLWEPGHTEVVYIKVVNKGTLAFNYSLKVSPVSESSGISVVNDAEFKLSDYLKFGTTTPSYEAISKYASRDAARTDATLTGLNQTSLEKTGILYASGDTTNSNKSESYTSLVVYMPEDVGNAANYKTGTNPPQINLGVTVYAWQEDYEEDSFGDDYDVLQDTTTNSYYLGWSGESAATTVSESGDTVLTIVDDTTAASPNTLAKLTVPSGTKVNGDTEALDENDKLKLVVESSDEDNSNITVAATNGSTSYDVSLLKIVETSGSASTTTEIESADQVMTVELDIGLVDLQEFYHKGTKLTKDTDGNLAENEYSYNSETGIVTFKTKSFSPFTAVYEFAGGIGTEKAPYLIETKAHMQHITDKYSTYNYYKVLDGVTTMDCTGWTPVYLHGSFDGNGISFTNVTSCLFQNVGYQKAEENITLKNFSATMNVSAPQDYGAAALVKNIFNGGTTTFDSVDVHGTIEGYWNIGSYYNYGTANYDNKGCNYTVNFVNCKSDADLICTSGNTCGGLLGHSFEGTGNSFTMYVDDKTEYTGTIYTTNGSGGKYFAMTSDYYDTNNHFIFDGIEDTFDWGSSKYSYSNTAKINAVAPVKGDSGYTVAAAEDVAKILVTVTAQLDAYDGVDKIQNLSGITMTMNSTTITENLTGDVKVLDAVNSAKIVNNAAAYGSSLADGVLTLNVAQAGANYRTGTARLTVTQYDASGKILCCGTTNLYQITNP